MRIKLAIDYTVCLDGIHPISFKAGDVVDFPERIALTLIGDGRADPAEETSMEQKPTENKMAPKAPENKMEKGAQKTKAADPTADRQIKEPRRRK